MSGVPIQKTCKISIKGKVQEGTETKNVTIATISGVNAISGSVEDLAIVADNIADVAQECLSATITGFAFTFEGTNSENYGTPGDELKSSEIFNEDFSDTNVTPTLQLVNMNGEGKTKTFNFKYMADPIDTKDFDRNVYILSSVLSHVSFIEGGVFDTFVRGDMTFTAKDTVVHPED